jgi:hypothetical protein
MRRGFILRTPGDSEETDESIEKMEGSFSELILKRRGVPAIASLSMRADVNCFANWKCFSYARNQREKRALRLTGVPNRAPA